MARPTKESREQVTDLKSQARVHTAMALRTLAHVAQSPRCPPAARVSACQTLLDRGWGKAPQEHTGPDGGDIRVTIRQIVEKTDETETDQNPGDEPATS